MRAVLDPNVLISGLLSPRGAPARLLERWIDGDIDLVVSEELLSELERALAYPRIRRRLPEKTSERFVSALREGAEHGRAAGNPPVRSRDPGDDYLLALAAGSAAALVSGDAHLLSLRDRAPVYSPAEFLRLLDVSS